EKWGIQTGANISQLLLSASGFLHLLFFAVEAFPHNRLQILSSQHRKHALTNFFVLSNIRFVSGGSSEMLRTSRCFRITLFQSVGPRTLSACASSPCSIPGPPKQNLVHRRHSSPFTADKLRSSLEHSDFQDQ